MKMNEPAATTLATLEDHAAFIPRHIGTTPEDQAAMLATLGVASRAALVDAAVPAAIREPRALDLPTRAAEDRARAVPSYRDPQPRTQVIHRTGLLWHGHAGRHSAQRARKPGVVHGVYAVPARDLAGTPRGPDQFPDDG